jgi:thymidylate kinase
LNADPPVPVETRAVHPLLADVFAALDAAEIRWCLLRGEEALASPSGDIDMMVDPSQVRAMEEALAPLAVVPVQRWGGGVHRYFLGYHAPTDQWIDLDVEPEFAYGPHASFLVNWMLPALRTSVGAGCLARRRQESGIWVLDPDDAFWALLLHCIVDKGSVVQRHRARLSELAAAASPSGEFGALVGRHCPPGWDAAGIIEAAAAGNWDELVAVGAQLPRRATAARPVVTRAEGLLRGAGRLPATAWRMRHGRGFSVAILGPDGAGKSTLSSGIVANFGLPASLVYMGLWQGEEGQRRSIVRAGLAAANRPLKVWRRYLVSRYHRARGELVIFDRHVYDALLPPEPPLVWAKRLFFGFLAHSAPGPHLVLVLDLPSEVTIQRRPEERPEHLEALRAQYRALAERLGRAQLMPAAGTPEEMRIDATDRIWRAYAARRSARGAPQGAGYSPEAPLKAPDTQGRS